MHKEFHNDTSKNFGLICKSLLSQKSVSEECGRRRFFRPPPPLTMDDLKVYFISYFFLDCILINKYIAMQSYQNTCWKTTFKHLFYTTIDPLHCLNFDFQNPYLSISAPCEIFFFVQIFLLIIVQEVYAL